MSTKVWIAGLFIALIAANWVSAQEPTCCERASAWLQRLRPAGGWCPYGGPCRWWKPDCLPRCGAPDDYCRKTLPNLCLPAYPPWYIFGPRQDCTAHGGCSEPGRTPRYWDPVGMPFSDR